MALVGDLASQTQSQLKASLVSLGSATAEDNGNAILKTFQVPFQPAPAEIAGTTDRMVKAQQDANPMTSIIQTRAEIDQQMQDLGANLSTAVLPVLKEFNTLITENKDEIQDMGTKIVGFVSKVTSIYSDHFSTINGALGVVAGGLVAVKGGKLLQKGYTSVKTATEWIGQRRGQTTTPIDEVGTPTRRRFTLRRGTTGGSSGGLGGSLNSLSSMTVNASVVYLNEAGGSVGKMAVEEIIEVVRDGGDADDLGAVVQMPDVAVTRMDLSLHVVGRVHRTSLILILQMLGNGAQPV